MDTYLNPIELILAERVEHLFRRTSFSAQKWQLILQREFDEVIKIARRQGISVSQPDQQAQVSAQKVYNVLMYGDPNPSWWEKIVMNWF